MSRAAHLAIDATESAAHEARHGLRIVARAASATAGFVGVLAWARRLSASDGSTGPALDPAAVTTLAGNGTWATTDGTGAAAEFKDMGGVVVVGGYAYVGTEGSIRKVGASSGTVTTLAGSATATGCTDSSTPSSVRFKNILDLATDGTYLYASQYDCGTGFTLLIRKVTISSGATTTLSSAPAAYGSNGGLTYVGGYLYVASPSLQKIDVSTTPDTSSTFASLSGSVYGIASDGTSLFVANVLSSNSVIQQIDLSTGSVSAFVSTPSGDFSLASRAVEVAGSYLYVLAVNNSILRRYDTSTAAEVDVAGVGWGYADGTGMDAWFSSYVTGIGADGSNLYIADSGNFRLRKATTGTAWSAGQPTEWSTTVEVPSAAKVVSVAGNGTYATVDGTGAAASLKVTGGVAVVAGDAYVGTDGAMRKVDLSTGAVSTLAGSASAHGCTDSADGSAVRFGTSISQVVTDGHFLYELTSTCTGHAVIRRTSIATGATSTIADVGTANSITLGPDGLLYYFSSSDTGIRSVDPNTGAVSSGYIASLGSTLTSLTSDGSYLWATTSSGLSGPSTLQRVTTGGTVTVVATHSSSNDFGVRITASAGDYIYALGPTSNVNANALLQIDKSTGQIRTVAGSGTGTYMDGAGFDGWIGNSTGLVSDGTNLWLADALNNRLRRATPMTGLPCFDCGPGSFSLTRTNRDCSDPVSTDTGNFYRCTTDLEIPGRGPGLQMHRTYNSLWASHDSPFGYGWTDDYNMAIVDDPYTPNAKDIVEEDGARQAFTLNGSAYVGPSTLFATLVHNGGGTWTFTRRQRQIYTFDASGQLTRIEDLNGYHTDLTYSSGRLSTVTDPGGRTLTFAYNTAGRVSSVTDSASRTVGYGYDTGGNLTSVTDVETGVTSFTYDTNHLLLTVTDPRGHTVMTNVYDDGRRVTSQTDALSHTTSFAYALDGTVTITDPRGNATVQHYTDDGKVTSETAGYGTTDSATTSYTYDTTTNGIATMTDPRSHVWSYTYDSHGNVLTATDPLSHTITNTYDSLNDLLSVTDPLSHTTTYTYDTAGNRLTASRLLTGTTYRTTTYTYGDSSHPGDITAVTDPRGKVANLTYDSVGNLTQLTDPDGNIVKYGYDNAGRRMSMIAPNGNVTGATPSQWTTTYTYNGFGDLTAVTDPLSHVTSYSYDGDRNRTGSTDADTNATTYTYDNANRLTTITRADTTTLANGYDADNNLTSQTDGAGNATTYTYDALNRVDAVTDPLSHTTSYGYDANGNRTSLTDPASHVMTFTYDNADRPTAIAYDDGTTPDVTYVYDAANRRTEMDDGTGTNTYSYDNLDRLIASTNGQGDTVSYGYDLAGNLTSLTYPDSNSISRSYDDAGRLTSIGDWLSHTSTFSYDYNGNLTGRTLGNGTTSTYTYNHADQNTAISHANSGGAIASFNYTRDDNAQITAISQSGVPGFTSQSYTYNTLNQLSAVDTNTTSYDSADNPTVLATGTIQKFNAGNELCWTVTSGTGTCASPPSGATTYSYDNRGNRTGITPSGSSATNYGYDQANRLTSAGTTATYAYDGNGLRAAKTVSSTTTQFAWNLAAALPAMLSDGTTDYVYGPGGTIIEDITGTTNRWYHADQLGSTRAITNSTGTVIATATYDTNGNQTGTTGTATTPFGWTGQYTDTETGYTYLRARYYDPTTAQFFTRDPANATTRSAYAYANNNPLNATDPTGLFGCSSILGELINHPGAALNDAGRGFANWSAGIGDFFTSTASGGTWRISAPYTGPGLGASYSLGYWSGIPASAGLGAEAAAPEIATEEIVTAEVAAETEAGIAETGLSASEQRAVTSLEQRVAEHQAKLEAYRADPYAYDNLGILENAPTAEIRQSIIDGRIRHLENEIRAFQGQIDKLLGGAG